ncbi:hypothetical protein H6768_02275 [Candidatus Peribacteria bacterium]|nr:hypothetical protein [Candidatus Peribacteria bacterium]
MLSQSEFYRAGKHRLRETKNQAKHKKPATLGSYIARTFCPEETPSVENK